MHVFDSALALEPISDGVSRGRTRAEWANMVGPFGGITAATLLHAVDTHPDRHGEPLALTVNYLAPIADGEFDITARPVRTNRTNQHWTLELTQDGEAKSTATAVFGVHRETWTDTEAAFPTAPPPEEVPASGFGEFVVWVRNFETRFVEGALPDPEAGPNPNSTTTLWVRDAHGRVLDHAGLAAVADIFYPRTFLRLGQFLPAGTISLTTYFHASADDLALVADDYVLATARANRFSAGYFDQSGQLWSRGGQLLATTHQLVYFKG